MKITPINYRTFSKKTNTNFTSNSCNESENRKEYLKKQKENELQEVNERLKKAQANLDDLEKCMSDNADIMTPQEKFTGNMHHRMLTVNIMCLNQEIESIKQFYANLGLKDND